MIRSKIIIGMLGMPCAGKGTLSKKIKEKFNCEHISAGELLRKQNDPELNEYLQKGLFVPYEISTALVRKEMEKSEKALFVFDGIPRELGQQKLFYKEIGKIDLVFWIVCSKEEAQKRTEQRKKATINRTDSTSECIEKRLELYWKNTMPVLEQLKKDGTPCFFLDTTNVSAEKNFEKIEKEMKALFD